MNTLVSTRQVFDRLLRPVGQAHGDWNRHIACFLASTCSGEAFPSDFELQRTVDVAIGDDRLACFDALREDTQCPQ